VPGADVGNPNGHEVRSRLSTKLLLEAAGDLVAEGGYSSLTLAMVGKRAGYSSGLATARFRTKAKLLEALVDRIVDRWQITTLMPQVEGAAGLEAYTIIVRSIREQYVRDPRSLRVLTALIFEALGSNVELNARRRIRPGRRGRRARGGTHRRGAPRRRLPVAPGPRGLRPGPDPRPLPRRHRGADPRKIVC